MLKKVLIANRGEIAVRIIRACRELGISTVSIYSEADKEALHAQLADYSVCVGPNPSKDSYLNVANILSACILTGCDAIHPGFGFLSENPKFAKMCEECNIKFIGPDSETISLMGDKSQARKIMKKANVPVVPGYEDKIDSYEEAYKIAKDIGAPIMIKASSGGGGKGIRIVKDLDEFKHNYEAAKSESMACFGDDRIYIEKYIENPRHIEFQIIADEYGNIIHLGERECSLQKNNQKVLEEAPSTFLNKELREKMGKVAIDAARAVNYKNVGTIEFLVDKDQKFYFMEMNTRIQVEHPITEMITDVDIVKEQLKIASGIKLSLHQEDIKMQGHAIECRINAKDAGTISELNMPSGLGVRVDSAIYCGYTIPPFYDSMIAKLITYGKDREEAIIKMKRSLGEFAIGGVNTNIDFQYEILEHQDFIDGNYDTSFLNKDVSMGHNVIH
ncbi:MULTISPECIES: acetyl-CoA carboxylase biotin carboxylase subunit [Romboutsia]|jgi:acetyl-CoA carboxylase biotin carboxylase subunit|uniref:acetyl-CoA carboxylase biotin carboxylase subunit n=1 Tax=Romboutsia TaxID=1501226 RepID=UPI0021709BA9|nr:MULTISPECIES: acetyl-CoA carboxylase biotin carboxylase subunit [Romboutsia]MCI9061176.1 acetyl-CoA carboxylase biotin carboxylase subunit [Romboutsia sp.]MCI9259403.1 acetyl-CoA carboxylase biotin carboxylase subunit [Romboutsia sp.]